jgi:DNA-binding PadR family transcriptional regulator
VLSDIRIYELSPGGVVELRDDWGVIGKHNLLNAILANLKDKHYRVKPLITDKGIEKEMEEIQALHKAVHRSIRLHTYGPQLFPEKLRNFDYSLGSIERILKNCEADSLIFVDARGHISTNKPRASVSLCVSDSSGTIVWYCLKGSLGEYDLRDPESATELVEDILSTFPKVSG